MKEAKGPWKPEVSGLQSICFLCTDLHTVHTATFFTCLALHRALSVGALSINMCSFVLASGFHGPLASFMLFSASFCVLCGSTAWAHYITPLLVVSSMSSDVDASLKISLIMSSSSNPCMISVNALSYSV